MQLPASAHTSRPWRIHEFTPDFRLEDVWALPTPGDREDFKLLLEGFSEWDPETSASRPLRLLFALRWKLGEIFGWDDEKTTIGQRVASLRERLPDELRDTPVPESRTLPFEPLYVLDDEFAAEIANETMHGVLHLGWVPTGDGGYRGQLAVLVKPNGLRGRAYMAAIAPFRHWIVYPQMLREIGREWADRGARSAMI